MVIINSNNNINMWTLGRQAEFIAIEAMDVKKGVYHLKFSKVALPAVDENGNDIRYIFRLVTSKPTVVRTKRQLLEIIKEYDKSDEINCVYIGEDKTWFDKNTRVGLVNSLKIQKEAGKTDAKIWYNVGEELKSVTMTIDDALDFLYRLELYAAKTFDVTESHIQAVNTIDNVNDLMAYNITADYPAYIRATNFTE